MDGGSRSRLLECEGGLYNQADPQLVTDRTVNGWTVPERASF